MVFELGTLMEYLPSASVTVPVGTAASLIVTEAPINGPCSSITLPVTTCWE